MKLLLDQVLPRSTAVVLRRAGTDAIHVGDVGLATASDASILERGRMEDRCVATLDADFHAIMALTGATQPSVIRVRIEGLRGEALARVLLRVIDTCGRELEAGALASVHRTRVKVRTLPLTR